MKGLLLKDLLNMKSYLKTMLFPVIIFAIAFIPQGTAGIFGGMVIILCSMMTMTTMSYDDLAKWDRYALTMPITRKDIVLSKYLLSLLFCGCGFIVALIGELAVTIIHKDVEMGQSLSVCLVLGEYALLITSLLLPLLYKFGVEKSRMLIMVCMVIPTFVIIGGALLLEQMGVTLNESLITPVLIISPFFVVAALLLSFRTSLKIYNKKDF